MQKKYIVRLSRTERDTLGQVVKKLKGSSQKVRRAQILLKADVNGSNWTDSHIAEAYGCLRCPGSDGHSQCLIQPLELGHSRSVSCRIGSAARNDVGTATS